MRPEEYEIMFHAETAHWWYRTLHEMVEDGLRRHGALDGAVLDAGCGTGAMLQRLRALGPAVGMDFSADALRFCRTRNLTRLARGSATALPFADASFDAVLFLDVLSDGGVTDPHEALREARRVLRPGGVVLVNLPAYAWLHSPHDVAVSTARRYTRRQCRELLRAAGFDVLEMTYWNTALFPIVVVVRLLKRALKQKTSDLGLGSGRFINQCLHAILRAEGRAARLCPMPFGLSVFAVGRRKAPLHSP
ncbi:MAG TPA: class I SAM-dependent methyltransferase [Candidatus Hydrogenedentes bacterium]|nr:class I SAM-dependent methyltransferase [Candidatus Hydrogenedentota bacterium]